MKKIDSQSVIIEISAQKSYDFISNFNNFEKFLPEQVTNWQATESECSFTIPNVGNVTLRMEKNEAVWQIKYVGVSAPAPFELLFELEDLSNEKTNLTISAFVEAAAFIVMMINKPVHNFISILLDKIKTLTE
ncbi:MAG: hypothetical protein LBH92_00115 [Bacteroidales bacterium]|jgi:hypothetical protein|nr:hypothetical protein [Bacteroidales bacterium]